MLLFILIILATLILFVLVPLRLRASHERLWIIAERAFASAAMIWSVAVSLYLSFVPFYEGVVAEGTQSGTALTMGRRTFLEVNGPAAIAYLIIPVILTALPRGVRHRSARRRLSFVAAVLLCGFVVVGALSVGLFYAPSALSMLIVAAFEYAGRGREILRQ